MTEVQDDGKKPTATGAKVNKSEDTGDGEAGKNSLKKPEDKGDGEAVRAGKDDSNKPTATGYGAAVAAGKDDVNKSEDTGDGAVVTACQVGEIKPTATGHGAPQLKKKPRHKPSKCIDIFCLTGICLILVLIVFTSMINDKTKQNQEEAESIIKLQRQKQRPTFLILS